MTDLGRRISAAAVLAGLDQEGLARVLGVSVRTLRRSLVGKRDFTDRELGLLLERLAVPEWFLREGFDGLSPAVSDSEFRDLLASQHDEVLGRLDALAEQLRELRSTARSRLPG
jgi:transcriptional regulator with XRE-family HTH domain